MKARDILPHAVIGAIITIVLLLIIEGYAAISMGAAMDPVTFYGPIILMALLTFVVGGFITSFLATKKAKDKFDRAVAASSLSALLAVLTIGVLAAVGVILAGTESLLTVLIELIVMVMLFGFVGVTASVIGGIILALIMGKGDSLILKSLKRAWIAFRKTPNAIVLPLFFSLLSFTVLTMDQAILGAENVDIVAFAAVIVGLIMTAFGLSSIIVAMQRKRTFKALFKESIKQGKKVLIGMLGIAIPPVAVYFVLAFVVVSTTGLDVLISALFALVLIASVVWFFLLSLVIQSMVIGNKSLKKAFSESKKIVKSKWPLVIGLLAFALLISLIIEVVLLGVDLIAFSSGGDTSILTTWISGSLNIIIGTSALTGFYMEAKK